MSEVNVKQHEEVEDSTPLTNDEHAPYVEENVILLEADETRGEWLKFGIVAVVLLFTVLIIALLRPLIFGKIVPAVLGEGQPVAPLVNSEFEGETIKQDPEEAVEEGDAVEEPAVSPTGDAAEVVEPAEPAATPTDDAAEVVEPAEPAVSPTDDAAEVVEPAEPADFPTAVPTQVHIVQAGETLTAIAKQYNSTVQAIVDANNIANPNRVDAGTELIIPVGKDQ